MLERPSLHLSEVSLRESPHIPGPSASGFLVQAVSTGVISVTSNLAKSVNEIWSARSNVCMYSPAENGDRCPAENIVRDDESIPFENGTSRTGVEIRKVQISKSLLGTDRIPPETAAFQRTAVHGD